MACTICVPKINNRKPTIKTAAIILPAALDDLVVVTEVL
jgi:hypothetical protein